MQTTASTPLVYISVLNWNNHSVTINCLMSLRRLDYTNYKILVVDNASQDNSVQLIRESFPEINLIQSEANLGYAGGHRLAMEQALKDGADLLWLLNNDLMMGPDALSYLVYAYQHYGEGIYGSVPLKGQTQIDPGELTVNFAKKYITEPFRQKIFVTKPFGIYKDLFPDRQVKKVASVSGSSILIPLSVVKKHGFLDAETFFMYGEENDYCFHLAEEGIPSYFVPLSIVFHQGNQSTQSNQRLQDIRHYYMVRNQLFFIQKYNGFVFYLQALIKNCILAVAAVLTKGKRGLSMAYHIFLGMWDAIRQRKGKSIAPEKYWQQSVEN